MIFGVFAIVDQFGDFILGMIPFYYAIKLAFLVWLYHPATNGATQIYLGLLEPFLREHEQKLENVSLGIENKL